MILSLCVCVVSQDYEARRCIDQKVEVDVSNACYGDKFCLFLFLPACYMGTFSIAEWDQNKRILEEIRRSTWGSFSCSPFFNLIAYIVNFFVILKLFFLPCTFWGLQVWCNRVIPSHTLHLKFIKFGVGEWAILICYELSANFHHVNVRLLPLRMIQTWLFTMLGLIF